MTVRIGPYRTGDFDTLTVLIGRLQEFERAFRSDMKPAAVVADPYVAWLLAEVGDGRGIVLMARDSEEIVGCIAARFAEDDDPCLPEDQRIYGLIGDLFVAESHRSRGVGTELLRRIEIEMHALGYCHLRVAAKPMNAVAVSFFSDRGYRPSQVVLSKPISA